MNNAWIWIVLIVALLLAFLFFKYSKFLKHNNLCLITGGVKCGKTTLAVALSVKKYLKVLRGWKIRDFFCRLLHIRNKSEKPLFYSNIPVKVMYHGKDLGYVEMTPALATRTNRFAFGSVILISECSLFADSSDFKDSSFNQALLMFNKIIAHETHGGYLFYESQSLSDCHNSIKKCLDKYYWINHCYKLPFFLAYDLRELAYSYDNANVQNVFTTDIDDNHKFVFISKRWWKCFDTYCYSALTDDLPVEDSVVKAKNLKCDKIVSARGYRK